MSIEQEIRQYIVEDVLFGDGKKLQRDTSFQESGILDSMGFLSLITFVEEKYAIQIKDREIIPENFDSLHKIAGFVEQKLEKYSDA